MTVAHDVAPGRTNAIEVVIPLSLPSIANLREHWAVKARRVKAQRAATRIMLNQKPHVMTAVRWQLHEQRADVIVTLTRVSPRSLDSHDNLRAAFKACVDSVADVLGVNDNDPRVVWRYEQRKGKAAVVIRLEIA